MMSEEARYDQIESYLKGQMSSSERSAFELEMASSPELQEELAIQKSALELMEHAYSVEIGSLVKEYSEVYKPNRGFKSWIWGGVGALVLVGLTLVLFRQQGEEELQVPREDIALAASDRTSDDKSEQITDSSGASTSEEKPNEIADLPPVAVSEAEVAETNEEAITVMSVNTTSTEEDDEELRKESSDMQKASTTPETNTTTVANDPCSSAPEIAWTITASNSDLDNGTIEFSTTDDDDFLFAVDDESDFDVALMRTDLAAGPHQMWVKYKECIFKLSDVVIPVTLCDPEKDIAFNPEFQSALSIPMEGDQTSLVEIRDPRGVLVYQKKYDEFEELEWDGRYSTGSISEQGLHKAIVKTSMETCVYNIVISR